MHNSDPTPGLLDTDTIEISIVCAPDRAGILTSELLDIGFEAFEEGEGLIKAFISAARWTDHTRRQTAEVLRRRGAADTFRSRRIAPRNWNREWEATLEPVTTGQFCIKPPSCRLTDEAQGLHVIEIEPKMSFGTGYHETTRLMLRLLPKVVTGSVSVLDAGTGTGVLAIAAARLGANPVIGFDVDRWAGTNALENVSRNDVGDRVSIITGDMKAIADGPFAVILANINLNTLTDLLPEFASRMLPDGRLVMSGVLTVDKPLLTEHARRAGLILSGELMEGEWYAGVYDRRKQPVQVRRHLDAAPRRIR